MVSKTTLPSPDKIGVIYHRVLLITNNIGCQTFKPRTAKAIRIYARILKQD